MKLFIIALSAISALLAFCTGEVSVVKSRDSKLISPGVTFEHAWVYQEKLTALQDSINLSIKDVVSGFSSVIGSSTNETLQQYEDHIKSIEELFLPELARFNQLKPSNCRNNAETILNSTTLQTGFEAGNCATLYDYHVSVAIGAANKALAQFEDFYNQVQTIVVKSFVGANAYLYPEAIEDKITEIYGIVQERWNRSKPELDVLRANLALLIAAQNAELEDCHKETFDFTNDSFRRFSRNVQTCITFDDSRNPLAQSKQLGKHVESYVIQMEEFQAELAKRKSYVWKA